MLNLIYYDHRYNACYLIFNVETHEKALSIMKKELIGTVFDNESTFDEYVKEVDTIRTYLGGYTAERNENAIIFHKDV